MTITLNVDITFTVDEIVEDYGVTGEDAEHIIAAYETDIKDAAYDAVITALDEAVTEVMG